jgi:hypothetical protein
MRYELADCEWAAIKPMHPPAPEAGFSGREGDEREKVLKAREAR